MKLNTFNPSKTNTKNRLSMVLNQKLLMETCLKLANVERVLFFLKLQLAITINFDIIIVVT